MYLQHLAINRTGSYRKATLNGKEHYVVPVSMIVPGVLPGSKGKLFYPADEIAKNYDAWNGMPLVVTHPIVNGRPVSARSPSILESHGVGVVLNAHINKNAKLVAEAWFDIEKTNQVDPRIIPKIEMGEQIELSTGLFTDNEPVKNQNAHFNGKQYTHIARNYRPDHLAILLDEVGACSIQDGCGVGVLNSSKKKKKNSRCWEGYKPTKGKKPYTEGSCEPVGNETSMIQDAEILLPKKERCRGCKKSNTKCECQPVGNLSPEKEPTENELSYSELGPTLEKELSSRFPGSYVNEIYRDYAVFRYAGTLYQIGYSVDKKTDVVALDSEMPTQVRRVTSFKPVQIASGFSVTNSEAAKMILNVGKKKIKLAMNPEKACKILKDGTIHGEPISAAQQGLFGAKCGQRKKKKVTQNVFSDEARAAALLARKKAGEAAGAIGKAGKAAVVSGVKAAGGAAKAGLVRTGQAYKEVAVHLLEKLKAKLGIGGKTGTSKKVKPEKPMKMAKDRTKEKQTSKDKYKARLAKIETRLKARKDAKAAKKSANVKRRELKSTVKKNISAIKSKSRAEKATKKRPLTEPKAKSKSAPKKTVSKGSNKKLVTAKGKDGYNKKTSSKEPNARLVAEAKERASKTSKKVTQSDLDSQKKKNAGLRSKIEAGKASIEKSKEKLRLARKIDKVNTATRRKEKAWGLK